MSLYTEKLRKEIENRIDWINRLKINIKMLKHELHTGENLYSIKEHAKRVNLLERNLVNNDKQLKNLLKQVF